MTQRESDGWREDIEFKKTDDKKLLREISFACNEVLKNKREISKLQSTIIDIVREISKLQSTIIDIKGDLLKLCDEMDKCRMHDLQLNHKLKELKSEK